jgi:predicted AlkP superfamily phosphohydrolase/phosphomutase
MLMDTRKNSPRRVLVIGWDGATFDLLEPFARQGVMPNLAGLLTRASWGRLASTVPPLTSPAWVTFATGKNPGKHGCLLFTQPIFGSGQASLVSSFHIDSATMWEMVSTNGKYVVSVNVPMTYPAQPVNGIVITGMMTPPGATFTFPINLAERYPSLQDYIVDLNSSGRQMGVNIDDLFITSPEDYIEQIDEMRRLRTVTALEILGGEPWDLFTLVYTGTDRLSHMLWRELETLARGQPQESVRFGHKLIGYLRRLDDDMGQFLSLVDDRTYVIVMSDHGFGPRATEAFYLNTWLRDAGLLAVRNNTEMLADPGYWLMRLKSNPSLSRLARRMARFLPLRFRGRLRKQTAKGQNAAIDWEKTRAHTVTMASYVAGIKISESLSESQKQAIVNDLIEALPEVTDPQSGARVIRRVVRREDLYTGAHVKDFPELIVVANEQYDITNTLADRGYIAPMAMSARTGDHRDDGILILCGEQTVAGRLRESWWLPDVAATILHLLDVPLPEDLDGRFIAEAFDPCFLQEHPVKLVPTGVMLRRRESSDMTSGEEEAIMARLRGLGYVE